MMDAKTALTIAGLAVTMIVGFWKIASTLGAIEFKIDLMWQAYQRSLAPDVFQRRTAADRRRRSRADVDDDSQQH